MKYNHNKAFSILELSIVLAVIALIFGGILSVRNLKETAKLNKIVEDITIITKAVEEFQRKHNQLPGDMYNPTDYFAANSINGDPANTIGNGNNIIDGNEGLYAFQHLVLAGILEGNFDGTWDRDKMYKGSFDDSVFYFVSGYGDAIVLRFSKFSGATAATGAPILTVKQMLDLENKMDDNNPNAGIIVGQGATCINGATYNATYINDDAPRCYFDIRIKKGIYSNS